MRIFALPEYFTPLIMVYPIVNLCIDKNNIIYKYQFGFIKNHSTQHASITSVTVLHHL